MPGDLRSRQKDAGQPTVAETADDSPAKKTVLRSAAELYREASAEQAKALRALAVLNRQAIDALDAVAGRHSEEAAKVGRARATIGSVERALLAIANELDHADIPT